MHNRTRSMSIVLILFFITTLTFPSRGAIQAAGPWYVAPTGSADNSCDSPDTPCATINQVTEKQSFTPGDMVYLAIGIYTGSGSDPVVNLDESITISGGWTMSFTMQDGDSIIDGQMSRVGIRVVGSPKVTIEHVTVQNGSRLDGRGGGVVNEGATLTMNDVVIQNNNACSGAGIANISGELFIDHSTVMGNIADCSNQGIYWGGGIYSDSGTKTTVNHTLISNNSSLNGGGGGIFNYFGEFNLLNSTIKDNSGIAGGGIENQGTLLIINSTISHNNSIGYPGGAIRNNYNGEAWAFSSTFAFNTAPYGAGIESDMPFHITNSPYAAKQTGWRSCKAA